MTSNELRCERFERIFRSIGHHNIIDEKAKKVVPAPAWGLAVSLGKTGSFMKWAKDHAEPTYLKAEEITEYLVRRYEKEQLAHQYCHEYGGYGDSGSEFCFPDLKDEQLGLRLGTEFVRVYMTMMMKDVAKAKEFSYKGGFGDYGGGFGYDSDDYESNDKRNANAAWRSMKDALKKLAKDGTLPTLGRVTPRLVMQVAEGCLYGKDGNGVKASNKHSKAPIDDAKNVSDVLYHTYNLHRTTDVYIKEIQKVEGWSEMVKELDKARGPPPLDPKVEAGLIAAYSKKRLRGE